MSEHTPTPWHQDDLGIFADDGVLARIPNHPDNGKNWEADAAFIVKAVNSHDALEDFVRWVDSWVSNPVGSYSVSALDGLFDMTRDRIAALASVKETV